MIDAKTIPSPPTQIPAIMDRTATGTVLIYQIVALIAFAIFPMLAARTFSTPFIGAMLEQTMVVNETGPRDPGSWAAYRQGLNQFGEQVKAIQGEPVRTAEDIRQIVRQYNIGDPINITFTDLAGERQTIEVALQTLPSADRFSYFYIPYLIGIIYLGCSLWVFSLRRHDATGRVFAIFATSVALVLGGYFDLHTTHVFTYLWTVAISLSGAGLFMMALVFPQKVRFVRARPLLRWVPIGVALLLIATAFPTVFDFTNPTQYATTWRYEFLFTALGAFVFFGLTAFRRTTSRSPIAREQAQIILIGSLIAFAPIAIWMLITTINPSIFFNPGLLLPLVVFPVTTAYAILRYRLLNTDYILSRAISYALLSVITVFSYAFLVWGGTLIFGTLFSANNPLVIGGMIFILSLTFIPLRLSLQRRVDSVFFRGQTVYRERMQRFSRELTVTVELPKIIKLLYRYIDESVAPSQMHIFLHDTLSDQYAASPDETGKLTTDIRFSMNSALVQSLTGDQPSLFLGELESLPRNLLSDRARLAILGAQLFVKLPGQQHPTGWMALSERRSGEPFGRNDLAFIEALGDQAALAIERAQVISDLERRVHEMDVLARIAQGVNITINFDDILELIYAQTNQVLTTQDFRITLYNKKAGVFYNAFYLADDERITRRENVPIPDDLGLEQEVVRGQRAILTDDYERECHNRSIVPEAKNIFAWVGVPLNTGSETIGTMSLGSSRPAVIYTEEQRDLLQSIADHAAGAIVKTQLLTESEKRARQLGMLNQVARSLTSMLDTDLLLNRILESAVGILDCEAGSLLLVDEQTNELVFEVTVGPVAQDLDGLRLAAGTGLVGKAVDTRQPIIVNNVHQSKDWFEKSDKKTGFDTQSLLVVPMQVRDKIIGVVEVLNKTDGTPFTVDDERLLTAFTAQAAVAIQNARMFTMTDQALTAKVEELSVMQRIDRELNASLDVDKAMQITLDWAIRQSGADAGFAARVGEEDEEALYVMLSHGYTINFEKQAILTKVQQLPPVRGSLENGQPQRVLTLAEDDKEAKLLPSALSQIVIPVRREFESIGILFLESNETSKFNDESLAFLARLSDHAAIAISNAQLYAAVQAANQAKSDFVSFVSHELKTPMTSIRGYTDLLMAGAVGTINEAQAGFLGTIHSNVTRMATLVSDLADISRIEAGRLRLDFGAISMAEIIDDVIRSTNRQIEEKEQQLVLDIPENIPDIWGDRIRLIQVITNLVSNAYKYTPNKGQITIQASYMSNKWDPDGALKVVRVAVQDTGIGLTEEDQNRIFTKFFRSEDQKAREAPGTGLGLNITKNLIEMQGGKIWFESEFRKGTTFFITVPVAETN